MNLRQIEMFRAVMQTGSFTAAAEALHISQPGVSRAIRHLEIQLGVPLFERSKGRIRPTDEANALHAEIERSFRGVQSIQQFASGLKHGTYAMLRVACSPNAGMHVVPEAVAALLAAHANARVSFEVFPRAQQLIDGLLMDQIDIGISSVGLDHPMLEARAIGHWELVCLFAKGHALSRKSTVAPADLSGEAFVSFHADTMQGPMVNEWFQGKHETVLTKAMIRSGQTAAGLVASGVGIALVDDLTARAFESQGLDWRPIRNSQRVSIQAVWSRHRAPSQQAMRLCKLVQQGLKKTARQDARAA